jgi:hypothetical protein
VARGCGQRAHYLIAQDGQRLPRILPLTEVARLCSARHWSRPASASAAASWATWRRSPTPLNSCAQARRDEPELRGGEVPAGWEAREGQHAGFARDLPQDDDAILKAIPRKQRAEVRRAQTFGLTVRIGRGEQDLADHYRIYSESVRNLGTPVFPRALFRAMLAAWGEEADILTVSKDGRAIASVFSLYFKNAVYPYWGGGTNEARSLRANEHMYHELMRHAAAAAAPASISAVRRSAPARSPIRRIGASSPSRSATPFAA